MILENAFGYLPEILTGSNYAAQDYEAGIVTAVALAVLQELNARNVPNPLSNICIEKLYDLEGFNRGHDINKKRYLRADMNIDLSRMLVGSGGLAKFGWRHKNWLEAKFFRKGKISSTIACTHIAADLIRLCSLVPPEINGKEKKGPISNPETLKFSNLCTGRYFLHVYDSDPSKLVGKRRSWVNKLRISGKPKDPISFRIAEDKAPVDFVKKIGEKLKSIRIELDVFNFCREQYPSDEGYLCVLTRIDGFKIYMDWNGKEISYSEDQNRSGTQSEVSALLKIRDQVGSFILLGDKESSKMENEPPTEDERNSESLETSEDSEGEGSVV